MKTIWMRRMACLATLAVLGTVPVDAWGPKTQRAIGLAAARVLTNEGAARFSRLESDIVAGASVSQEAVVSLSPLFATAPLQAIQSEIQKFPDLLQRKAEVLRLPNEMDLIFRLLGIEAIAGRFSLGLQYQSLSFVEADGFQIHPGGLRQGSDGESARHAA